jgi:(p)ppGpp synthase/HD superfamily hydrolase
MINKWSIDEMQEVWYLVSKLHDGQKYGGTKEGEQIEYINHIGSVTFEIINALNFTENIDAALAIKCAILHDVIEDTAFNYSDVKDLFGTEVANGVLALSKNEEIEGKLEKMLDSIKRIKEQPKEVWAVKMADRITNLFAPPYYWTKEKIINYIKESEIILEELKDGNGYLAERLKTKIKDYHIFLTGNQ